MNQKEGQGSSPPPPVSNIYLGDLLRERRDRNARAVFQYLTVQG